METRDKLIREQMKEWGKKGGRPQTAPHVEGWGGCRCLECRKAKVGTRKRRDQDQVVAEVELVPVVAPVGTGGSRAKEKEEPVVVVREEEPRPAPVTALVEGKVNPIVAKLRATLGLKVATEVEPLEEEVWEQGGGSVSELPEGHVYLDELEVPFSRAYQCAVMNKKGSGLKQVESGRWVAKREWVDGMKEAGR